MKVRIKVQPTGYVSLDGGPLNSWPKAGSVVDLPDVIAEDLIGSGHAEKARLAKPEPTPEKVETRPAPTVNEERRGPRPGPAAAKKGDTDGA